MDNKTLLIIIIISIWIISLLIAGILALIFKEKYKKLKKFNGEIIAKLENLEKNFQLKEVKIEFELSKNEKCFFYQRNINAFQIKIKSKNIKRKFKNFKSKLNIYVTNKRILFETFEEYLQFPISKINSYYNSPIYLNKNWINGLTLFFQENKIVIENDNSFNLFLTLKSLKQERKYEC
ncbi:hypothetical protein [Spiroplasma taiwanense]|uniref:Transmembrane protein n=1 Tax=Spiroplasma taiwanense CT-1 TaxID=1276220 RepID=S5LWZ8_9MOLU|nr:hypothetical protein [Spiroplasma taiwanense]AGR41161.1 hypothetical protein STAIW_v1c05360 [Spiroplasma taiwanense CT-1]